MDNTSKAESTDTTNNSKFALSKGIVVLLDLLGTKEMYKISKVIDKISKVYDELLDTVTASHSKPYVILTEKEQIELNWKLRFFSDTLLLIIDEAVLLNNYSSLCNHNPTSSILVSYCRKIRDIFCQFLQEGLFPRGVISYGDIWVGDNLIIGPAIDEAQEWYELGDWIGIFLTPCAYFEYKNYFKQGYGIDVSDKFAKINPDKSANVKNFLLTLGLKFTVDYSVPLKNNTKLETRAINWPAHLKDDKFSNGKTLWEVFSQRPIFPSFYSKYKNTLDFYHHVLKENREDEAEE